MNWQRNIDERITVRKFTSQSSDRDNIIKDFADGMIAGLLNKFGKIGVILGFCVGNIVLAYVSNGYTVELIHFKEILVASIALLAIPKSVKIDIEEFVGTSKFLPVSRDRTLTKSKETIDKLNNVSETIDKIADTYNEKDIDSEIAREENKQIFITELLNNLEPYRENLFNVVLVPIYNLIVVSLRV